MLIERIVFEERREREREREKEIERDCIVNGV